MSVTTGQTYGGTPINNIVKLNNNSGLTINSGFSNNGLTNFILSTDIKQLSNGKYLVSGLESTGKSLRRLNSDGTVDTTFTENVFSNNFTGAVAVINFDVQSDGKIVLGGRFNLINGSTYENYARLNSDGTIDTTFYSGGTNTGFIKTGATYTQTYVKVQPDGKLLYYGNFNTYSGSSQTLIVRLTSTGTLDTTFSGSTTFSSFNDKNSCDKLLYTTNNKLLILGNFRRTLSGNLGNEIVMLNSDGTRDTTFDVGTGFILDGTGINCEPIEESGNRYVIPVGYSNSSDPARYNGTQFGGIIRLNSDGTIDTSYLYGRRWRCDGPAPFTQVRSITFSKIIINNVGNYVLTYSYSSANKDTVIYYNNPSPEKNVTNGGYAILDNTGAILKC